MTAFKLFAYHLSFLAVCRSSLYDTVATRYKQNHSIHVLSCTILHFILYTAAILHRVAHHMFHYQYFHHESCITLCVPSFYSIHISLSCRMLVRTPHLLTQMLLLSLGCPTLVPHSPSLASPSPSSRTLERSECHLFRYLTVAYTHTLACI